MKKRVSKAESPKKSAPKKSAPKKSSKFNLKSLTLKSFKNAAYNPRKITKEALQALDKSITQFGDLSGVVINSKTGTIVAGHQRIKTLDTKETKIIVDEATDDFGTVSLGYILVMPQGCEPFRIPLRIVEWDLRTEKLANIAANNLGGKFDNQKLGKLLAELDTKKFDIEMTGFTEGQVQTYIRRSMDPDAEADEKYVKSLASPIYKIEGKKPKLSQLFDTTKTDELKTAINKTAIPPDVKMYLLAAAERHTKFRFDLAAEFYAHAPKAVQALMEDCALVIVDHKKAIEHGYLKLTEEIMDEVTK